MFQKTIVLMLVSVLPFQTLAAQLSHSSQPAASSQRVSFNQLAEQCGSTVHPDTLQAVARVESKFNPFVIGGISNKFTAENLFFRKRILNKLYFVGFTHAVMTRQMPL